MASVNPHPRRPEGRIISFYHLDVHVEGRRLGAAALDLLILLVLQTWINDVFGVTRVTGGSPFRAISLGYVYFTSATTVDLPWLIVLFVAYFTLQEALFGATWGKLVAGLRVVAADGLPASPRAVLLRNLLRPIDYWPGFYLFGAGVSLLSPLRQRLGDRVAGTLVVRAESAVLAYRPAAEVRQRLLGLAAAVALFVAFCFGFSYYGRPPLVIHGLVNTGVIGGGKAVAAYSLGASRWSGDVVTYPLRYRLSRGTRDCSGYVTLRWGGFFTLGGGWRLAAVESRCQ